MHGFFATTIASAVLTDRCCRISKGSSIYIIPSIPSLFIKLLLTLRVHPSLLTEGSAHSTPDMSKVALIVGGTGGLGAACAEDLAKDHTVIVAGRNKDTGETVVGKIASAGGKAEFRSVDVTDAQSVTSLHSSIVTDYGRLDVAINAGGIVASFVKLVDSDAEDFDRCMAVNVRGTYLCMQEQIKAMLNNPDSTGGSIVNFSSVYGLTGSKWGAIYSTFSSHQSPTIQRQHPLSSSPLCAQHAHGANSPQVQANTPSSASPAPLRWSTAAPTSASTPSRQASSRPR